MKCKFKTLSRFAHHLGIYALFSVTFYANAQYITPKSWYDVNEDGNFEVISWDRVYSINSSTYICPGEFSSISNFYPGFCYGFADFDFDGKTDIYGNYESKYGNSAIWLNATGFESVVPSGIRSQIIPIELYGDGRKYAVRSKSNFLTNGTDLSAMPFDSYLFGENNQLRYTPASIMTINQYNGLREELNLSKGGDGIPGWGDMFAHTTNDMWGRKFLLPAG